MEKKKSKIKKHKINHESLEEFTGTGFVLVDETIFEFKNYGTEYYYYVSGNNDEKINELRKKLKELDRKVPKKVYIDYNEQLDAEAIKDYGRYTTLSLYELNDEDTQSGMDEMAENMYNN